MNDMITTLLDEAPVIINNLHFIRADWFYLFIPLFFYLLLCYKIPFDNKSWASVIDPNLLPFVLAKSNNKQRRYPLLLVFIAASLCITALAGPVYKKLPQPVYREQSSLVVLLDLSQSMNATDIKPSRLSRAKLELLDLLNNRKTGQTALIVYAADAFVVTPLTDDNATIANLTPSLETDMMPAQGSNLSSALAKTFSLFTQAGIINGDILVITDDIHQSEKNAIKKVSSQGHRLSILGVGTTAGGPIPLPQQQGGGFLQDNNGAIVIPKLQPGKLQGYALSGSGLYTSLQADDSDINKLTGLFQSSEIATGSKQDSGKSDDTNDLSADLWQEEGHWLLLPLLFFAALWARKGWIAVLLPFALMFVLPLAQPVYAEPIDSKHLWSSPDQKAMKAFNAGDHESAAKSFTQDEWKASAFYRNGNFEAAAETLKNTSTGDGFYNKANALARLGKYEDAIKAYDKALELDENNTDAIYNREQVKKALKQQQQEQSSQDNTAQDDTDQQQSEQDSEQQDQQQGDKQQDSSGDNDSQQQESQQQNGQTEEQPDKQPADENSDADSQQQKQAEEEQLKQRDAEAETRQEQQEKQQYEQQQKDTEDKEVENKKGEEKPAEVEVNPTEASITEDEKATEQWLKRVPDDPGGLLRRKFHYQYKQIPNQSDEDEPW